jgi:hypothetical protein
MNTLTNVFARLNIILGVFGMVMGFIFMAMAGLSVHSQRDSMPGMTTRQIRSSELLARRRELPLTSLPYTR